MSLILLYSKLRYKAKITIHGNKQAMVNSRYNTFIKNTAQILHEPSHHCQPKRKDRA